MICHISVGANAWGIVLSRYLWRIAEKEPSAWEMKGVAIAAYTFAVIC